MADLGTEQIGARLPSEIPYDGKLIIGTCFYNQHSLSRYTQSMVATAIALERHGVKWDFWPVHGEFHIERAINSCLSKFLHDPEATDIILIDSDESWDVMSIFRLLSHEEEIVGGAYKMKNHWEAYTCSLRIENGVPIGRILNDGTALLEALRVPAGFLRLRKPPLRRYIDKHSECYQDGDGLIWPFFQTAIRDGKFFSQDFNFSERLRENGEKLWIDPNCRISHFGLTEYPGHLDADLRKQDDKPRDVRKAA